MFQPYYSPPKIDLDYKEYRSFINASIYKEIFVATVRCRTIFRFVIQFKRFKYTKEFNLTIVKSIKIRMQKK
ncbi:hypothetical protein DRJ17_03255 [Candidatus Woesearchaeota archaeon]|nr:MAG: hypothetical protein DRJ17_03255 [Candidatus Woesearchaeota archaeon]